MLFAQTWFFQVANELTIAKHQIETFETSNSFDLNLLEQFKTKQAELHARRNELMKLETKIENAIREAVGNANAAVQQKFDDVQVRFSEAFDQIVGYQNCSARMELLNSDDDDVMVIDGEFGGLQLYATFGNEEKPFEGLENHQKNIVSLVLILSMQQTVQPPMPFYLYEYIDEVIAMISFDFDFDFVS